MKKVIKSVTAHACVHINHGCVIELISMLKVYKDFANSEALHLISVNKEYAYKAYKGVYLNI